MSGAVVASSGRDVAVGDILVEAEEPELVANVRVLQSEIDGPDAPARFGAVHRPEPGRHHAPGDSAEEIQLDRALERTDALKVRSAVAGVFLSPAAEDLPGRYAKRGDVLGYVIFQQSRIARVVVTQDDIDLVRSKLDKVDVRLANGPSTSYQARIVREVPAASDRLPSKALTEAGGGRFAADPRDSNQLKTLARTFQFDLELPPRPPTPISAAACSCVSIMARSRWPTQWYRRLRQLFLSRFET